MTIPSTTSTPPLEYTIVAAVAANGVIGRAGDLAWRHRDDLQRVKAITMGHTLVMGRKNFDSIGRPLPGRRTVVVTRQPNWSHDGVTVVHDTGLPLTRALTTIASDHGDGTVIVFGGSEIYRQLMSRATAMELTEIDAELDGDVVFPQWDRDEWWEVRRERRDGFSWVRYVRRVEPTVAC